MTAARERRAAASTVFLLGLSLCALPAQARDTDDDGGPGARRIADEQPASGSRAASGPRTESQDDPTVPPRRAVPDYDGRPESTDPAEELLWIPRLVLSPLYALFEHVIRRPLGALSTAIERERWALLHVYPFFLLGTRWGVVPTVLVDFGFLPSVGLYAWFDDVGAAGHRIGVQLGFGGVDWLRASITDRITLGAGLTFEVRVDGWTRPDRLFLGAGPDAVESERARYAHRSLDLDVGVRARPWRSSEVRLAAGVSANEILDSSYVDSEAPGERTISEALALGWFEGVQAPAPGFGGFHFVWQRLELAIDSRERGSTGRVDVRLEAHGELAIDLVRPLSRRWLAWGGALGVFWDVSAGRTLGLWIAADLVSPMSSEPVPLPELPDFSVRGRLVGFQRGWIIGQSVVAATLEYRYPIWVSLLGYLNVSVGNAFGESFSGFSLGRLRSSYALGVRTIGDPDQSFSVDVGFGTAPFDRGGAPAVFRATAGVQRGF